ncbi:unnamed protein product [Rangifer tarandus platyrhynchus]|uniref:Uncharacterized protein n=1 Tax=Rangifer tarandus platyrhynchus TaxID=3082113 RepID=A0ACB1KDQ2_RANTA
MWAGLQAAFVSLHNRLTVPNSAPKGVMWGPEKVACLPVQSEGPLRASGCFQLRFLPGPPRFSQLPGRGQGRYSSGWALPGLLSLSLLDGDENVFLSPLLTWVFGWSPESLVIFKVDLGSRM